MLQKNINFPGILETREAHQLPHMPTVQVLTSPGSHQFSYPQWLAPRGHLASSVPQLHWDQSLLFTKMSHQDTMGLMATMKYLKKQVPILLMQSRRSNDSGSSGGNSATLVWVPDSQLQFQVEASVGTWRMNHRMVFLSLSRNTIATEGQYHKLRDSTQLPCKSEALSNVKLILIMLKNTVNT